MKKFIKGAVFSLVLYSCISVNASAETFLHKLQVYTIENQMGDHFTTRSCLRWIDNLEYLFRLMAR